MHDGRGDPGVHAYRYVLVLIQSGLVCFCSHESPLGKKEGAIGKRMWIVVVAVYFTALYAPTPSSLKYSGGVGEKQMGGGVFRSDSVGTYLNEELHIHPS